MLHDKLFDHILIDSTDKHLSKIIKIHFFNWIPNLPNIIQRTRFQPCIRNISDYFRQLYESITNFKTRWREILSYTTHVMNLKPNNFQGF